ncbi:uncharacterized protein [Diadema setosum]|uniref:uncharacterized protein n=1 Tax=Diadema setosum TaxID=31175 RepID=UPI003B3A258B
MSSYVGARIQLKTKEGIYEGTLHSMDAVSKKLSLEKARALPSGQRFLGLLNFYGQEIEDLEVIEESLTASEPPVEAAPRQPDLEIDGQHSPEIFDDYATQAEPPRNEWDVDLQPMYSQEVTVPFAGGPSLSQQVNPTADIPEEICNGVENVELGEKYASVETKSGNQTLGSPPNKSQGLQRGKGQSFTLINRIDNQYALAVGDMERQAAIGLALKGVQIGRRGKLSLILVQCGETVYMFDALSLGPALFTQSFIDILEATNITKVIHDSRFVSDFLYHQYGILLNSVFDTQVGDILIQRRQNMGHFPTRVRGTTQCILEYLDVSIQDIALHCEGTSHISENEASWMQRPLPSMNCRCAVLDVVHLLPLHEAITEELMAEFTCAIDIYLSVERDRLEMDARQVPKRAAHVPRELINDLHQKVSQRTLPSVKTPPVGMVPPPPRWPQGRDATSEGPPLESAQQDGLPRSRSKPKEPSSAPQPCQGNDAGGRGLPRQYAASRDKGAVPVQMMGQGMTAKPVRTLPPRPPLMQAGDSSLTGNDGEGEEEEEVLTDSSEESDDNVFDTTDQHMWQHRYALAPAARTTCDASPKSRSPLHHQTVHSSQDSATRDVRKETCDPFRNSPKPSQVQGVMHGPRGNIKTRISPSQSAEAASTSKPRGHNSSREQGPEGVAYSSDDLHGTGSNSLNLRNDTGSQLASCGNKASTAESGTKEQSKPKQQDCSRKNLGHEAQEVTSSRSSYADITSGRKKSVEEGKLDAKRTLRAIGKALASGRKFAWETNSNDREEDEDLDTDDSATTGSGGLGSPMQGTGGKAWDRKSERSTPARGLSNLSPSPSRTVGRGRASIISDYSPTVMARPSQLQQRANGFTGYGRGHTVRIDFPSAEEMESAPDRVPIPAGSSFLSQRAI